MMISQVCVSSFVCFVLEFPSKLFCLLNFFCFALLFPNCLDVDTFESGFKDDDAEKRSDEAIGSSRDSLDGIEGDTSSDTCDTDYSGNCDPKDRLDGIYAEPMKIHAKPRKIKPPPLYANLVMDSIKENIATKEFQEDPPPLVTAANVQMRRILFDNWAEYLDGNGRRFYYNTLSHQYSWKPPRRLTCKVDPNDINGNHHNEDANVPLSSSLSTQTDIDTDDSMLTENVRKIVQRFNEECLSVANMKLKRVHSNRQNNRLWPTSGEDSVVRTSRISTSLNQPRIAVTKLLNICPPKGWNRYFDTLTKEVYFVNKWNNIKVSCLIDLCFEQTLSFK